MALLSRETEADLTAGILERVETYLTAREQVKPKSLGLLTGREVREELGINPNTLKSWERLGLRRYQPPLEESRKVYYRTSDILKFLGVDR